MKNLCVVLAIALSMSGLAQVARAASFTDTFDSIDPAWVTDRYEPAAFVADGGRLRIDISTDDSAANRPAGFTSMFYNTQGRRRDAAVEAPWRVSGDIFLASSLDSPGSSLFRSDLWTRDSHPDEGASNYAILGFTNETTAAASGFRLRAFDSQVGWIDLGQPAGLKFGDWNTLTIEGTGDAFVFSLNGIVVHTDNTASVLGNENLRTVYVEAYNFGDSNYSVLWDNISAQTIPTPAAMGVGVLGFGLLALRRGRRAGAA